MEKRNKDIRELIKENNVKYWQIAEKLGISDITFSRRLRKELDPGEKAEIVNAINEIKKAV